MLQFKYNAEQNFESTYENEIWRLWTVLQTQASYVFP